MKINKKDKTIFFDMDGTLVNLYESENWLEKLNNEDISLYEEAKLLINIKEFKNCCKALKEKGYNIGIISYLPWDVSSKYKKAVKKAKENYIKNHLSEIEFDEINICEHEIPKSNFAKIGDVLIDDDKNIRKSWNKGKAYTATDILSKLKKIYLKEN